MQNRISQTHPVQMLLGTLLLLRDYAGKAWHVVFGPGVTECVEYAKTVRGTLNSAAADTAQLDVHFAAALSDGVIDEAEATQLRAELERINRNLCTGASAAS